MPVPPIEAVTALLHCRGEVYMVHRQPHLAAFGGYTAFPGGKIDDADRLNADRSGLGDEQIPDYVLTAMARELHEELGIDGSSLRRHCTRLQLHERALSPENLERRFDTWFVELRMDERPVITLDAAEAQSGQWLPAERWLQRFAEGRLLMTPPTRRCLARICGTQPAGTAVTDPAQLPMVESVAGVRQLLVRSTTLPPAEHTNCLWLGDPGQSQLLVDPAPRDETEFQRLLARLSGSRVDRILISHHHLDHRDRAHQLALSLGVPLLMSAVTHRRIRSEHPGVLDGCEVHEVSEGDTLTQNRGQPVQAIAVPGHDDGQLALMPADRAWCFVGDLIQGLGTVVIKRPEGDMAHYMQSLARIIALDPAIIIPSHGIALGSCHRLRETLLHRQRREQAVLELAQQGVAADAMLPLLYPGLQPPLTILARMTIDSHLDKLRAEARLSPAGSA